jgi:hypothetical protein
MNDRGAVWVRSIGQSLRWLLDEVSRPAPFELAALSTPLDLLDTKLAAFAVKKAETLQARSDFDALLDADGRKLVRELNWRRRWRLRKPCVIAWTGLT